MNELNILDYWLILKKRKYPILLTTGLVVAFTFAVTQFVQPTPFYEASARVKYDRTSSVASLLLESLSYSGSNDLGTQAEVIRSFPIIEEVARELHMFPEDVSLETRRSAPYLNTIYALQGQVKTARENDTTIIKVTASAEAPERAERIANTVAQVYRSENIKARNRMVTDSRRFVEEQVALRERMLNEAEEALRSFKERRGQVFLTEEAKAALDLFTKLEEDYNKVLRLKDEAFKQIGVLKRQETTEKKPDERIFTEDPSALLAILNGKLSNLLQERATLLIYYTPEHPQVKELDQKIRNVKTEMARELEFKIKNLNDREAALKEQIDQYRARYLNFPKAAIELARLDRDVKINSDLYATLKVKHQELLIKSAEQIEEVTIIAPAVAPAGPVNAPNNRLNMVVGTVMGVFLGIVLAFARESFDTSIGTIEGVEEFLKVPVLGVIPRFDEKEMLGTATKLLPPKTDQETILTLAKLACLVDPKSVLAESFRSMRTNIQFTSMDRKVKSILFTSAGLGEGKTTTVTNLAITLAQEGQRVLLVDADLRRPVIHKRFGIERKPGLLEALGGKIPWRESVRTVTDLMLGTLGVDRVINTPGMDNLNVLTSGADTGGAGDSMSLAKIAKLVPEMQEEYDVVLIDSPPILPVTDAVTVSSQVDGTVLVYQVGRIGRNALKRAKFLLDHAHAQVLGVVLTNVHAEITPDYGYYEYAYR